MHESIFKSSLRSFFRSFSGLLGIAIALTVFVVAVGMFGQSDSLPLPAKVRICPDAEGHRVPLPESAPVLVRLDFHGVIGQGDLSAENVQNLLLDAHGDMFKEGRVKGLLLHMNTPGGYAEDSDVIYRAIMGFKKKYNIPVYAYVEGLCASGGMYIASAADKIYADPGSVIGSVGVLLGPTFNFSGAMQNWGVQSLTLTEGKDKDALNPFRPWKEGEDASIRAVVEALYKRFVSVVVAGRPHLDAQKLVDEYGAHVFISAEAAKLGYVDVGDTNYAMAVDDLRKTAGIEDGVSYQVIRLETAHSLLENLTEGRAAFMTGKITHEMRFGSLMGPEMAGRFLYLYAPHG